LIDFPAISSITLNPFYTLDESDLPTPLPVSPSVVLELRASRSTKDESNNSNNVVAEIEESVIDNSRDLSYEEEEEERKTQELKMINVRLLRLVCPLFLSRYSNFLPMLTSYNIFVRPPGLHNHYDDYKGKTNTTT